MKRPFNLDMTFIFIIFFYATCAMGLSLASLGFFSSILNLTISFLFAVGAYFYFKPKISLNSENLWLLALIILHILLRYPMFDSGLGGQDEGLYVHYGKLIADHGSLHFVDDFRQGLSPDLKKIYDSYSPISVFFDGPLRKSFTVPFYPLLPVVLATFGFLNIQIGLLIVGLVNLFLFRLILRPFLDKTTLILCLLFITLQPHLIFFSKFPVSETLATVFVLSTVLLILKMDILSKAQIWLISASIIFLYLMTRMNFPIAVLFIFAIFLRFYSFNKNTTERKQFLFILLISLMASCIFYYHFQYRLFRDNIFHTYIPVLQRFLKVHYFIVLAGLTMAGYYLIRQKNILKNLTIKIQNFKFLPICLVILFLVISLPTMIRLTSMTQLTPYFFDITKSFESIRFHSFIRFLLLVGPLILVPFFIKRKLSTIELCITAACLTLWTVALQWTPWIPYQYYYSRYFVSEFLPLLLILLFLLVQHLKKAIYITVWLLALSYNVVFSFPLLNGWEREEKGYYSAMKKNYKDSTFIIDQNIGSGIIDGYIYMSEMNVFGLDFSKKENISDVLMSTAKPQYMIVSDSNLNYITPHCSGNDIIPVIFKNYYLSNNGHIYDDHQNNNYLTYLLPLKQRIHSTILHVIKTDCLFNGTSLKL